MASPLRDGHPVAGMLQCRTFLAVTAAVLAGLSRIGPLMNADLLWQLRAGEALLARQAPNVDVHSRFFRGGFLADHEKGFEVLVAYLVHAGGFALVSMANLALLGALLGVSVYVARGRLDARDDERAPACLALAVVLVLWAMGERSEFRAEYCTFVAIAVTHGLSEKSRSLALRCLAPVVTVAVASFFHGLAVAVAAVPFFASVQALAADRTPRGRLEAAALLGACFATVGAWAILSPAAVANIRNTLAGPTFFRHIIEVYSPAHYVSSRGDVRPLAAIGIGVLATLGLLLRSKDRRSPLATAMLVGALTLLGGRYVRLTVLSLAAATPWVLLGLTEVFQRLARPLPRMLVVASSVTAVVVAAIAYLQSASPLGFSWSRQPTKAIAWLGQHRANALLFHGFNHGCALIYANVPSTGVLIDPRAWTLYPEPFVHRYYEALAHPDEFESWAEEAPFDTVMLTESHQGSRALLEHLRADPRWNLAYNDGSEAIFVRRDASVLSP